MMPSTRVTAAAFMLMGCCLFSASASAGTQKDIQSCRAAITAQGTHDISQHRLRYLSHKGNRTRIVKLEAIPYKSGERFKLTCQLDRKNKVVAINDQAFTKLAVTEAKK